MIGKSDDYEIEEHMTSAQIMLALAEYEEQIVKEAKRLGYVVFKITKDGKTKV